MELLKKHELMEQAQELGIGIIEGGPEQANMIGIHLKNPDANDLSDAIEQAVRDDFTKIIIHTDKTENKAPVINMPDNLYIFRSGLMNNPSEYGKIKVHLDNLKATYGDNTVKAIVMTEFNLSEKRAKGLKK